jgi:hypothetical protein
VSAGAPTPNPDRMMKPLHDVPSRFSLWFVFIYSDGVALLLACLYY